MVNGVLYATAGTRRAVVALDAATGEQLWKCTASTRPRGAAARGNFGRGLAYWSDGKEERILYVTPATGSSRSTQRRAHRSPASGQNGAVDLKVGVIPGGAQIDLVTGEIGPPFDPHRSEGHGHHPARRSQAGYAQETRQLQGLGCHAFDRPDGQESVLFRTIPAPGEFGNGLVLDNSWRRAETPVVWTQMAVGRGSGLSLPARGTADGRLLRRPSAPGMACWRDPGAVDLENGSAKVHYSDHHGIWDMDIASPPVLTDITGDGRTIKAVGAPTKQDILYVFDAPLRPAGLAVRRNAPWKRAMFLGEWYSQRSLFPRATLYGERASRPMID